MAMVGGLALDYFLFVFLAALGVIQMAAAYNSLRGLLFFKPRPVAMVAGMAITAMAFVWFFASEPRNVPDTDGGLDGNQAAGLFALGAGLALLLTLIASSVSNRSLGNGDRDFSPGLDALRETTYIKALLTTVKKLWKSY